MLPPDGHSSDGGGAAQMELRAQMGGILDALLAPMTDRPGHAPLWPGSPSLLQPGATPRHRGAARGVRMQEDWGTARLPLLE